MNTELLHELCEEASKTGTNISIRFAKEGCDEEYRMVFPFECFFSFSFEEFVNRLRPNLIKTCEGYQIVHLSNTFREPMPFQKRNIKTVKPKRSRRWI